MRRTVGVGAFLLGVGVGCGGMFAAVPVPPEHADLVGSWTAPDTTLEIHADGQVAYEHHSGGSNTSVNGPVTEWTSDSFTVMGLTTFHVESAPELGPDGWEATIDGLVYHRDGDGGSEGKRGKGGKGKRHGE